MQRFIILSLAYLASANVNADTFLNNGALANNYLAPENSAKVMISDEQEDRFSASVEPSLDISPEIYSPSAIAPHDPGFEPTSELMRETDAKREANDRLWQSLFSLF